MARASNSLTSELAAYIAGIAYEDIPADVLARAREAVVDGLGVMLAGSTSVSAHTIGRYLSQLKLSGAATVVGSDGRLPGQFAALANGTSGHALDYDDTQISAEPDRVYGLLTHPTVPVLAAALAVSEEMNADGRFFLSAFCCGVEVACKMAEAINPEHYRNGFHSTGTLGVFGAAAAASRLLNLEQEQCRHALGIAASKSAGIRAAFGTMTKPYHAGAAAENGVVAAQLAALGYTTDPDALDGRWGFFQVAGRGCDEHLIRGKLGNPYSLVQPGVSIKPYPCGSLAHPSMDALLDILSKHAVTPEAVQEVRLGTSSNVLNALRYPEPQGELEAKFSIPFCLAILVLEGRAGIAQFTDETVQRSDVRAMMSRVKPYLHQEIEARGFDRIRSLVEVQLNDGRVLSQEASTSRGTPERPMTPAELAEKFHDCARDILPQEEATEVLRLTYQLENIGTVRELTQLLRPGRRSAC